jgi:NRAMP (natural resistance-associated macrophage protein)-like metal ion transporter
MEKLRAVLRSLGPGLITGAADDDPSGITTYSVVGAQHGYRLLWTAWLTWPMMAAVQLICARIGMVTGRGLMAALRRKLPRPAIRAIALLLLAVNTLTVAADLAGMGDAANMLIGAPTLLWVVVFGATIAVAAIQLRYVVLERVLKWLTLALFAYVVDGFYIGHDWGTILHAAVVPTLPPLRDHAVWTALVAVLGTTISPYLFFWQTSQEVEEEKALGRTTVEQRWGMTRQEFAVRKRDVGIGTFLSNLVMFFIILATALTLHASGRSIETSREAAEALRPLAGGLAALLYTVGLIGTGALAIPTMSGSAAYALAETFGWRQGIDQRLSRARSFYAVMAASIAIGIALNFAGMRPVKAMYFAAILNGLLAPIVLIAILMVAVDRKLMRDQPASKTEWWAVAVTTALMTAAAAAMLLV